MSGRGAGATGALLPRDRLVARLDRLLLRRRERLAEGTPASARAGMRALFSAAADRAHVADGVMDAHAASALALYREAALLYAAAVVAGRGSESITLPPRADELLPRFQALALPEAGAEARHDAEAFLAGLASPDVLAADRLDGTAAAALVTHARHVARWLAALVEPRSVAEIKLARRVRVGVVGLTALAALSAAGAALVSPENVALHKPVSLSANHPQSVSPPSGLTDGITSGSYGAETTTSEAPWIQVDLLRVFAVDTIKVYNRGDTAFDAGLPMILQCSKNGVDFADLETRATTFSQARPWVAKAHGRPCRYVRVRGARGAYVALAELEVFGSRR